MTDKNKNESGLPTIAEFSKPKKAIVVALAAFIVIGAAGSYFYTRGETKPPKAEEETYRVDEAAQATTPEPASNVVPIQASGKQVENKPTISNVEMASLIEKQKELQQRLMAPLMVVNGAPADKVLTASDGKVSQETNPNLKFLEQVSSRDVQTSTATAMNSLSTLVAQGSFIRAIMESATNSDLPGYLRAIVSEPVYSEDGKNVLIPRGSRLIGEYKSGMLQGQSRIFIVWSRVITPSYSIQIGSTGTDNLGVAGIGADVIDRHFWQRFGMASLLSIIGTGAANVGVSSSDQNNSASTYRSAIANSFSQSANESLQQDGMIAPTLKTYQGKPIMVFVAKDLEFGGAMKSTTSSINIF